MCSAVLRRDHYCLGMDLPTTPKPPLVSGALLIRLLVAGLVGVFALTAFVIEPAEAAPRRAPVIESIDPSFSDGLPDLRVSGRTAPNMLLEIFPQAGCSGRNIPGLLRSFGIENRAQLGATIASWFSVPLDSPPEDLSDAEGRFSLSLREFSKIKTVPQFISIRAIGRSGQHTRCRTVRVPNSSRAPLFQPGDLIGGLDHIGISKNWIRIRGWAIDTAQQETPPRVEVTLSRATIGVVHTETMSRVRPDIRSLLPGPTQPAGFVARFPVFAHHQDTVCVTAVSDGGKRLELGCRELGDPPIGSVPRVRVTSPVVSVSGWAISSGTTAPAEVEVLLNGRVVRKVEAKLLVKSVGRLAADHGRRHGYRVFLRPNPGRHRICVRAIDPVYRTQSLGFAITSLGCQTVTTT